MSYDPSNRRIRTLMNIFHQVRYPLDNYQHFDSKAFFPRSPIWYHCVNSSLYNLTKKGIQNEVAVFKDGVAAVEYHSPTSPQRYR